MVQDQGELMWKVQKSGKENRVLSDYHEKNSVELEGKIKIKSQKQKKQTGTQQGACSKSRGKLVLSGLVVLGS